MTSQNLPSTSWVHSTAAPDSASWLRRHHPRISEPTYYPIHIHNQYKNVPLDPKPAPSPLLPHPKHACKRKEGHLPVLRGMLGIAMSLCNLSGKLTDRVGDSCEGGSGPRGFCVCWSRTRPALAKWKLFCSTLPPRSPSHLGRVHMRRQDGAGGAGVWCS